MGVADFSGGYVIHLAAGTSGFVAAAIIGPRLQADRDHFPPNSLLVTLIGAGILWLGWNGFNGGDPYFANADAGAAVLNTNVRHAVALLVWTMMDKMVYGKPSVIGAVNGMIAGLVAITPSAGYVDGMGAIIVGVVRRHHSVDEHELAAKDQVHDERRRYAERVLHAWRRRSDRRPARRHPRQSGDAPIYRHRQGRARRERHGPAVMATPHQLLLQAEGAAFIIVFNAIATFIILKVISIFVPLRMDEATLKVGDDAVHGETAYAIGVEGE